MSSPLTALSTSVLTGTSSSQGKSGSKTDAFSMDTFMKLIAAQMSNQDPLNPQSNTDMIAQMAQFTSLQTLQSINASLAASQTTSAAALLGTTVSYTDGSGFPMEGTVNRVLPADLTAGKPLRVVLEGGMIIPFSEVKEIRRAS